ncbi:MAG: acyl-ACP--UDP-N-acetylglucosamine O-acyltransferase [Saprospiraceae bacterium]|nr:acyl-ACP--UDP-N-acetylglucosamine O-acyltransferase [Saprospiraceae bacterium]
MSSNFSVVHPNAKIGNNVEISPFVTIAEDVVIGDNCWLGSGVCIMNGVRIGNNVRIFPGAIVGTIPQDLKFVPGKVQTYLEIGDNVTIREYCTLNIGTEANIRTIIKENCLLMAYVHVAHDCIIERNCILANNVTLAGHIEIGEFAVLGGMSAIHQFVKIGEHVMISGGSLVRQDIPPFIKVAREPLSYVGLNSTGLKRRSFNNERINHIQDIYRYLFVKNTNISLAVEQIKTKVPYSADRQRILEFIINSERGLVRGFRSINPKS